MAKLGPTLCSVCFPAAPVELRRKRSDVEREAREAEKAAKAEAKFIKNLRPEEQFRVDGERITTVVGCEDVIRKEVLFRDYYGRGEHSSHAAYVIGADKAAAVLRAREARQAGTGAGTADIGRIIESAVKRNRKEGARI